MKAIVFAVLMLLSLSAVASPDQACLSYVKKNAKTIKRGARQVMRDYDEHHDFLVEKFGQADMGFAPVIRWVKANILVETMDRVVRGERLDNYQWFLIEGICTYGIEGSGLSGKVN